MKEQILCHHEHRTNNSIRLNGIEIAMPDKLFNIAFCKQKNKQEWLKLKLTTVVWKSLPAKCSIHNQISMTYSRIRVELQITIAKINLMLCPNRICYTRRERKLNQYEVELDNYYRVVC